MKRPSASTILKIFWISYAADMLSYVTAERAAGAFVSARWDMLFVVLGAYYFAREWRKPSAKFTWADWWLVGSQILAFVLRVLQHTGVLSDT